MSEELKPCPFCGNENIQFFIDDCGYTMICTECMALGPLVGKQEAAISAWNRRS